MAALVALSVAPSLTPDRRSRQAAAARCRHRVDQGDPSERDRVLGESLSRHLTFYWPEADSRPQPATEAECAEFSKDLASGRPVLATRADICGAQGSKVAAFRRYRRIHDKHHQITLFAFGPAPTR